ncbi:hypothetical protein [Actinacidiphila paucisporea]|uniref:3-oxoacyl-[acyl-carrier protein] reductase n=1 Tax=Actinacidiphila paucisporea TaxID=310782 RepID=A0A1M6ZFN8_9ACTN|nr:hypothetical protein [Actinacidiphila paucisporea]SHL29163.1 3-oxoacyl-[acyl-carrier protein] reductase [Actinacidiphila paucisporea]
MPVPVHVVARDEARTPPGRLGEPEGIAGIVGFLAFLAFLASEAGRWVTGQSPHAAGGMI